MESSDCVTVLDIFSWMFVMGIVVGISVELVIGVSVGGGIIGAFSFDPKIHPKEIG